MWKLLKASAENEDVDVLPWYLGVKLSGQDVKTSVIIGRSVPIAATPHSTIQAIVEEKTEVEDSDHDWKCEKIVPSATGDLNIGENVGYYIFSEGKDGRG